MWRERYLTGFYSRGTETWREYAFISLCRLLGDVNKERIFAKNTNLNLSNIMKPDAELAKTFDAFARAHAFVPLPERAHAPVPSPLPVRPASWAQPLISQKRKAEEGVPGIWGKRLKQSPAERINVDSDSEKESQKTPSKGEDEEPRSPPVGAKPASSASPAQAC